METAVCPGADVTARAGPSFLENAVKVLEARYLRRDPGGHLAEDPQGMLRRVAHAVAQGETAYSGAAAAGACAEVFLDAMARLDFLPSSPVLMNAGTPSGQLSACFVLPVEDNLKGIFDALQLMALIQQSGGGTGFSFSRLRPRGDALATTGGASSGPVSFLRVFDCATENIRLGGKRRGANMGVLRVDHPDIEEFIDAKRDGRSFRNFNLSVAVPDAFMRAALGEDAADGKRTVALRHPHTGQVARAVPAAGLLDRIARAAWQTGDPGLLFLDAINRDNPTPTLGPIEATNPCAEAPLLPYESCNLGSINLSRMVRVLAGGGHTIDWEKLAATARLAVRFLDDVLEVGRWPDPRIESAARRTRKVGLGVMGFAELLILLGVPYDSEQAAVVADGLMRCLAGEALVASHQLAHERGVFPAWDRSMYAAQGLQLRNATRTAIAPTGSISLIAGTSAGIEPLFALAYRRHVLGGQTLTELNPLFLRHARREGFHSEALLQELQRRGTLAALEGVPGPAKALFRTALEIAPGDHLRVQAAFQRHVDGAVAKTVNLPSAAGPEVVTGVYRRAWELGLKGVTVYRYGSKGQQVLELGTGELPEAREHFAHCDPRACKV